MAGVGIARHITVLIVLVMVGEFCVAQPKKWCKEFPRHPINNIAHLSTTYEKITVYIHGSLPPPLSSLARLIAPKTPYGLVPARQIPQRCSHSRVGHVLHKACPERFPLDSFYLFGWSGTLSFEAREEAAEELYLGLRGYRGKIDIVAISHGGNVALNLEKIAEKYNDQEFCIDTLILLATPVQKATEQYVQSALFKSVFSFYSCGDLFQVVDPQGLYKNGKKLEDTSVPLFSDRIFPPAPNIIQTRLFISKRNPYHIDFAMKKFYKNLPALLELLETSRHNALIDNNMGTFSVNIPPKNGCPHFWVKTYCSCTGKSCQERGAR